jgi:hypothetical protein
MRSKLRSGPRLDCCVVSRRYSESLLLAREEHPGRQAQNPPSPSHSLLISNTLCEVGEVLRSFSEAVRPVAIDRDTLVSHRRRTVALPIQTLFNFLHNRSVCSSPPSRYCCTPLSTACDLLKTRWLPPGRNALQTPTTLQIRQSVFKSALIRLISHDLMLQIGHHLHPLQRNVQRLQR